MPRCAGEGHPGVSQGSGDVAQPCPSPWSLSPPGIAKACEQNLRKTLQFGGRSLFPSSMELKAMVVRLGARGVRCQLEIPRKGFKVPPQAWDHCRYCPKAELMSPFSCREPSPLCGCSPGVALLGCPDLLRVPSSVHMGWGA